MSKEYTDKQINSMILHLRLNDVAEMYYLDNSKDYGKFYMKSEDDSQDKGDYIFFDYKSGSHLSKSQVIALAIETKWEDK